ncbi:pro-FMRFamide-related neuropeptide FF like isoform X2 [Narcine bancroftii]
MCVGIQEDGLKRQAEGVCTFGVQDRCCFLLPAIQLPPSMEGKRFLLVFFSLASSLGMTTGSEGGELKPIHQANHELRLPARAQTAADEDGNSARRLDGAGLPSSLVNSLIRVPDKTGRNPSFGFRPQRFGRKARRTSNYSTEPQIHSRGWDIIPPQFRSMTAPQRFGKRK